jgi:hypothetical protein
MHSIRQHAIVLALCLAGTIGCDDSISGPTSTTRITPEAPQPDVLLDRYPTQEEFLSSGGRLEPSADASANPNAEFVTDATGSYALRVSAAVAFQFVNDMEATLSAYIKHSTSGNILFSNEQSYRSFRLLPVMLPHVVPLGFTISAGTNRCGIMGRADLSANGALRLLNNNWSPVTLYSLPLSRTSSEPRLADCEERKTTEEPAAQACDGQTAFSPAECTSGGSTPNGGSGGGCGLWVRRIWVSYDGGLTWRLESESFFTKC